MNQCGTLHPRRARTAGDGLRCAVTLGMQISTTWHCTLTERYSRTQRQKVSLPAASLQIFPSLSLSLSLQRVLLLTQAHVTKKKGAKSTRRKTPSRLDKDGCSLILDFFPPLSPLWGTHSQYGFYCFAALFGP